jgi:hypothetical protein
MPLSPLRKKLNLAFGLMLLGVVAMVVWPLVSRPFVLRAFCNGIEPDSPLAALHSRALEHGFKVSPESNGVMHVYDLESLGKFSCTLSLRNGRVQGATFVLAD